MTPGWVSPALTRRAPISTTSVRPTFKNSVTIGPGRAIVTPARMSRFAVVSLAASNRRIS